jgi:retron-type reverse transcriptase
MKPTLFDRLTSFENLHAAAWAVFRGKRRRRAANALFVDLEGTLFALQAALRERRYVPGAYTSFWIHDPKRRLISAAPLLDRVVHHALIQTIEPIFERRFIHHSYACRAGKGTHRCLRQFTAWARETRYVLKLDLSRFFPSIDHAVLKAELRRALHDEGTLWLADTIIDGSNPQEPVSPYFPGDDLFSPLGRRRGLPIGNLTSQFFGNVLLDRIDHLVKDRLRVRRYLRYVDDLAAFGDDKPALRALRDALDEALTALRLRLHPGKSRIRRLEEGVEFLGFVMRRDTVRLNQRAIARQRRRLADLRAAYAAGAPWSAVAPSLVAWSAHAAQGTTARLRDAVFAESPFVRAPARPLTPQPAG